MAAAAVPQPQPQATSWAPTAKVSVGVLGSAIVTIIMTFWKNHPWTSAETAALTSIVTFIVQYWTPERK